MNESAARDDDGGGELVVTRLSPMARSVRHLTEIAAQLQERGIDLVVLEQGIDTITPAGRFTFHVLGAMDEMFAGLTSDGTRERLATSAVPAASRPRHQAALPDQRYRPSSQRAMLR